MPDATLSTLATAEHVSRVYVAQRSLGCETSRPGGHTFARNTDTPLIYDANFSFDVEPELAADAGAFESALDRAFDGAGHRKVVCGPTTAPIVEAQLVALGFEPESILQLVLEGALESTASQPADTETRRAETDADWASLVELQHMNFNEQAIRNDRLPFERAVAEQMVASWRAKHGMAFWLTAASGRDCAYFGSWVGLEGLGMVESLFTDPAYRHRGIATTLIEHCVGVVRAEGARAVLIGADIEDTPKKMYLELGFRPVCVTREWLRLTSGG